MEKYQYRIDTTAILTPFFLGEAENENKVKLIAIEIVKL